MQKMMLVVVGRVYSALLALSLMSLIGLFEILSVSSVQNNTVMSNFIEDNKFSDNSNRNIVDGMKISNWLRTEKVSLKRNLRSASSTVLNTQLPSTNSHYLTSSSSRLAGPANNGSTLSSFRLQHRFEATFQGECGRDSPCEHACFDLHDGLTYECACNEGFTLNLDGYSCTPAVRDEAATTSAATTIDRNPSNSTPTNLSATTVSATSSATNDPSIAIATISIPSEDTVRRTPPTETTEAAWYMDYDNDIIRDDMKQAMAINDKLIDDFNHMLTNNQSVNKTNYFYELLSRSASEESSSSNLNHARRQPHRRTPRHNSIRQSLNGYNRVSNINLSRQQTSSHRNRYQLANLAGRKYHSLCNQLECESGGTCFVEPLLAPGHQFNRARCRCPLGRGGQLCQRPVEVLVPRFRNQSYLALPMINDKQGSEMSLKHLLIEFKPHRLQESLILFTDSGDLNNDYYFIALVMHLDGSVELLAHQINDPSRFVSSRSASKVRIHVWNRLLIRQVWRPRDDNDVHLSIEDEQQRDNSDFNHHHDTNHIHDTPFNNNDDHTIKNQTIRLRQLFLGGTPNLTDTYNKFEVSNSFDGCIRSLNLNNYQYNFRTDSHGDSIDGFDIGECGDTASRNTNEKHFNCIRHSPDPIECLCLSGVDLERCINQMIIVY